MFLSRNKTRPRQSAVDELGASKPYAEIDPSPRTPIHVRTTSQALRGPAPSLISAPSTNPTLTSDDIELDLSTMHRFELGLYSSNPATRPILPSNPPSAADSSTIHTEFDTIYSHHRSTTSVSETSVSLGRRPPASDFGGYHLQREGSNKRVAQSTSPTTLSEHITPTSPSQNYNSAHIGSVLRTAQRGVHAGGFYFPRPTGDGEIDRLFREIEGSCGLDDTTLNITVDQKWQMVYNAEYLRWSEERRRERQTKKQAVAGQVTPLVQGSPEWYIQRFMHQSITPRQASSLEVSLRTNQLSWFKHFVSIQGTPVLAQALVQISRKTKRQNEDIRLEFGIAKCIKIILTNQFGAQEAYIYSAIVSQVAASLNTPHLQTRMAILDVLTFFIHERDFQAFPLVVDALKTLSTTNDEAPTPYAYWFKSMNQSLPRQSVTESSAEANDQIWRVGSADNLTNDYAVSCMTLIYGILVACNDLDLRVHHRSQMEAAGLHRILELLCDLGHPPLDKLLKILQQTLAKDEKKHRERLDQESLKDFRSLEEVFDAIRIKTEEREIQRRVDELDKRLENHTTRDCDRLKLFNELCKTCSRHGIIPNSMQIPDCSGGSVEVESGGFANVSRGTYDGRQVAIKVLRMYVTSDVDTIRSRFCREGVAWKHLRHPNILPLLGVILTEHRFALVSDWMENGNINEFIERDRGVNRIELLAGVASGLKYMHDLRIVHGDLKGVNILINKDRQACIADFGLSTITGIVTHPPGSARASLVSNDTLMSFTDGGTRRWMSPELLDPERFGMPESENNRPTKQSDCYALGMVIYEVLCGHHPYLELQSDILAVNAVMEGDRPEKPERAEQLGFSDELWKTVERCWLEDRNARPSVEYILSCLNNTSTFWNVRES